MPPGWLTRMHPLRKILCSKVTSGHKSTVNMLNEKEKAALQYLGGYVLCTLHKRIRKSKDWMTNSKQQVLAVLQAGKQSNDCETAQRGGSGK